VLGLEELGDTVGRGCGIIAADGDEELDVVALKEFEVEVLFEIFVGRFEAAHLKVAATSVEVGVRLEEVYLLGTGSLAEKAGISAVEADYAITIGKECLCYRANDGIHTRSRATAAKDDD
jgi:hypothetical protein